MTVAIDTPIAAHSIAGFASTKLRTGSTKENTATIANVTTSCTARTQYTLRMKPRRTAFSICSMYDEGAPPASMPPPGAIAAPTACGALAPSVA